MSGLRPATRNTFTATSRLAQHGSDSCGHGDLAARSSCTGSSLSPVQGCSETPHMTPHHNPGSPYMTCVLASSHSIKQRWGGGSQDKGDAWQQKHVSSPLFKPMDIRAGASKANCHEDPPAYMGYAPAYHYMGSACRKTVHEHQLVPGHMHMVAP